MKRSLSFLLVAALGCSGQKDGPPAEGVSSTVSALTAPGHGPLVVGTSFSVPGTYIYTPDAPNQFPQVGPFALGDAVASGDLDHDGVPEVLVGLAGVVGIFEQSGTPVSPASVGLPGTIPFFSKGALAVGDINGDGFGDVVVVQPNVNNGFGEVSVVTSHGAPQIPIAATEGLPFPPGAAMVVCDLNKDGFSDILVAPSFLMYSGATGKIQPYQPSLPFFNPGTDKLACADLNNDGFDDVIIAHPEGGGAGFFQVLTDPSVPPIDYFPNGFPAFDLDDEIAAGDLDGDGFPEVAIGHIPLPSPGTAGPLVGVVTVRSAPGKTAPQGPTFLSFLPGDKLAISNAHPLPTPTSTPFTIPYVISFIMYEPPGDKGSVGYSMGTTLGSTTAVTASTKEGVSVNASLKVSDKLGVGGGASVTFSQTTTDTTTASSTVTSAVTMQASGGQDPPDHNLDQFFIIFDSQATALDLHDGRPPNIVVDISTGTLNKLTAGQLREIANSQPSSIEDPTLLALVTKDIRTPADANQILAADPFQAGVDIAQNPDRFAPLVPVGQSSNTVMFSSPSGPGVGTVTNTYSAANMQGSSHGMGNGVDFSENFNFMFGLNATVTLGFGYSKTVTKSTSTTTTDTITIGSDKACTQGTVELFRDLDFGGSILTKTNLTNPCQQQPMQTMSFEALPDWQIQGGGSATLSPAAVTGAESFSISAAGWTPMVSQPLASALLRGAAKSSDLSKASFALEVPVGQPNPFWIGAAQMYISAPSANVSNAYMGQVELTPLPKGQFVRLGFTIPSYALHALTEDHPDVSFTIVLNVNAGTSGWLIDDLTIGG